MAFQGQAVTITLLDPFSLVTTESGSVEFSVSVSVSSTLKGVKSNANGTVFMSMVLCTSMRRAHGAKARAYH